MEDSPTPESPPLPKKGSYNIDFDALDEFSNPFESKNTVMLGSSPPIKSSSAYDFDEKDDPFKSKTAIANSPPGSPKVKPAHIDNMQAADKADPSLSKSEQLPTPENPQSASVENKPSSQVTPKKKKIIKKPQVQSKFKPPKVKHPNNSGDIDIIMPGIDSENNNKTVPSNGVDNLDPVISEPRGEDCLPIPLPVDQMVEKSTDKLPVDFEDGPPPQDAAPDAMALSMEIDRRFIDGDEIDDTEQFEFKDARDWTANISENARTGLVEPSEKASAGSPASRSGPEHHKKSGDESGEVNSSHQKVSESSKEKHPAVRALQTAQEDVPVAVGKTGNTMENKRNENDSNEKDTVVQLVQVLRYSQTDWNKMKQELELNFQTSLLNKERDWSRLLADRDKKIANYEETNKKLKSTNEDMRAVVTEFEKTIAQLQAEKEKMKNESHKSVQDLEGERNQALEDLASVESAFSDLHRRYEKSKTIVEGFKRNEEQLKECLEDLKLKLKKSEAKLTSLRSQAEEKLDKANEDIEKMKKSTKSEVARLEASLKKSELRISSCEEALVRKEKENQELTAICDELIAKVGS